MERYICLDLGNKRIGIAVSDPFNTYALPLEVYTRKNLKQDLEYMFKTYKEKGCTAFVCGLPVNFDGTPSVQTEKAQFFIDKLKENGYTVFCVDERCTTIEAEEVLIKSGKDKKERKLYVDGLAAASILDGFLLDKNTKK